MDFRKIAFYNELRKLAFVDAVADQMGPTPPEMAPPAWADDGMPGDDEVPDSPWLSGVPEKGITPEIAQAIAVQAIQQELQVGGMDPMFTPGEAGPVPPEAGMEEGPMPEEPVAEEPVGEEAPVEEEEPVAEEEPAVPKKKPAPPQA
jgi:hypothetical protein